MRDWMQMQLNAGLPAFAGTSISGTVAVKQELLNELIARWLADSSSAPKGPSLDVTGSRHVLKSVAVRAETGTLLVDFKVVV